LNVEAQEVLAQIISDFNLTYPDLWKTLASVQSGPSDSENFSTMETFRLEVCKYWQIFKDHFYKSKNCLKTKSVGEIFKLWKRLGKFSKYVKLAFAVVKNDMEIAELNFALTFNPHFNSTTQMKLLISTFFENIDEAISNEQRGDFELARLAYKKALVQMSEAASAGQSDTAISKLLLMVESDLKTIVDNWEWVAVNKALYKPNPLFQLDAPLDLFFIAIMKIYQKWGRLQFDIDQSEDRQDLYNHFIDIVTVVREENHLSQGLLELFQTSDISLLPCHIVEQAYSESKSYFRQWYIPEKDRTTVIKTDLAFDFVQQMGIAAVSNSSDITVEEMNDRINEAYTLNRKKYSTLTQRKRVVFGSSQPPQTFNNNNAKKHEETEYVDDITKVEEKDKMFNLT
jgi:tetratricopeptide (TPR) repeat protein